MFYKTGIFRNVFHVLSCYRLRVLWSRFGSTNLCTNVFAELISSLKAAFENWLVDNTMYIFRRLLLPGGIELLLKQMQGFCSHVLSSKTLKHLSFLL